VIHRTYDQWKTTPDEDWDEFPPADDEEDERAMNDTPKTLSAHTPGPWEYIPSTKDHGPYVVGPFGGDICDCYTMSNLSALSVRNGGDSKPVHFFGDSADANARLIAAAPAMLKALRDMLEVYSAFAGEDECDCDEETCSAPLCKAIKSCAVDRATQARRVLAQAEGRTS
jgi:hypothetical protein